MAKHFVFVYGTLKSGEPNYGYMAKYTDGYFNFISKGKTARRFPLVIGTKYNIPFLLNSPGNGHNVHGEIYEVDDTMLKHLDILEDHPNFYIREIDDIITESENKIQKCWVYLIKNFRTSLLDSPFLESYSSSGSHGLPYCERYIRQDPAYNIKEHVQNTMF